jgi:hypothetical protein
VRTQDAFILVCACDATAGIACYAGACERAHGIGANGCSRCTVMHAKRALVDGSACYAVARIPRNTSASKRTWSVGASGDRNLTVVQTKCAFIVVRASHTNAAESNIARTSK